MAWTPLGRHTMSNTSMGEGRKLGTCQVSKTLWSEQSGPWKHRGVAVWHAIRTPWAAPCIGERDARGSFPEEGRCSTPRTLMVQVQGQRHPEPARHRFALQAAKEGLGRGGRLSSHRQRNEPRLHSLLAMVWSSFSWFAPMTWTSLSIPQDRLCLSLCLRGV